MGHTSHTRVFLRKGRNNLRIAKLVVSPFLPEGETPLRITERGVEGDDDI
jgi:DNA repair protein RadA